MELILIVVAIVIENAVILLQLDVIFMRYYLTFKEYNMVLDSDEKVNLLAPRNSKEGYLIESGFITSDKNVKIPNANSIWSISGNNKLTSQSPIKLTWTNDQGISFEKEISIAVSYTHLTLPTKA